MFANCRAGRPVLSLAGCEGTWWVLRGSTQTGLDTVDSSGCLRHGGQPFMGSDMGHDAELGKVLEEGTTWAEESGAWRRAT